VYRLSFTNKYDFTEGWARGFSIGLSISDDFQNRTYYYSNPDRSRVLFSAPELGMQFHPFFIYQRKIFRNLMWRSQVNVANIFNHYKIGFQPNNGTGFTDPANVDASFYGQPRSVAWTNTISF
jgi:hypothetical protein